VADDGSSLLDVLRDQLGLRSVKDGCSPQGQCGCCTVWVDGSPRVSCVTPVRRLQGREITTLDGLPPDLAERWTTALVATGGSQCGFCTPGIIMRLAALGPGPDPSGRIDRALLAHLCRCTGWTGIEEAALSVLDGSSDPVADPVADPGPRSSDRAGRRASLEGRVPQVVGPAVVAGRAGFADDTAPAGALVAVPDGTGGYIVDETVAAARARAHRVQGRNTTLGLAYPVEEPPGPWALTLRTTWVEPAYVEPDASWCVPGGRPASPLGNGGAFGGKVDSPVTADARRLADRYGRPVRVLWSREDVVRRGPKRPPVAAGIDASGNGILRVGVPAAGVAEDRWAAVVTAVATVAPGLVLEAVPVVGPGVSFDLRGAVWAEAAVLAAVIGVAGPDPAAAGPVVDVPVGVRAPDGGRATARCRADGSVEVAVDAGPPLDEVVLRSYCLGAAHQAVSWVCSEGIAVDDAGAVHDLTVRSFGILSARDMPPVTVVVDPPSGGPAVNGSDAVFAAVAAARWLAEGLPSAWPTGRGPGPVGSLRPPPGPVG